MDYDSQNNIGRSSLSFIQISILFYLRFCEAASDSVIYPFLHDLLTLATGNEEKVGYYSAVLFSTSRFVTLVCVMFWSRLSDYLGRKPILFLGTFALFVSMVSFSFSTAFWALVLSGCIFPAFNSNHSVIKGTIGELTDESNRADAFAFLLVPWASGTAFGTLIGGWLGNPHHQFPSRFHAKIWIDFPYLLPYSTIACLSLIGCFLILFYFKETLGNVLNNRSKPHARPLCEDDPSQPLLLASRKSEHPLPLKSVLTYPVLLACTNYCIHVALDASSSTLQVIVYASAAHVGGLGLSSASIGYMLGLYGFMDTLAQIFLLPRLIRRYGEKQVFMFAVLANIPRVLLLPVMNWCLRRFGWDGVWSSVLIRTLLAIQVACRCIIEMGFGPIYIFINASAPNRRSLGTVNGLGQTFGAVGRIVLLALSSSLFSFSIENRILGGYGSLAYGLLLMITLAQICVAQRLPRLGGSIS